MKVALTNSSFSIYFWSCSHRANLDLALEIVSSIVLDTYFCTLFPSVRDFLRADRSSYDYFYSDVTLAEKRYISGRL